MKIFVHGNCLRCTATILIGLEVLLLGEKCVATTDVDLIGVKKITNIYIYNNVFAD